MYYKVKEVSDITGLSVRMLHHYDKINLLKPDHVTEAGYRQYSDDDLSRLQQIFFLRELDFSLVAIKKMLNHSEDFYSELMVQQKQLLELKVERILRIIDNIDSTQKRLNKGESMTSKAMFDGFDNQEIQVQKEKYVKEVEEKWGHTQAYSQSKKRTAKYGPEDYKRIQEVTNATYANIVNKMDRDVSDKEIQALVGDLRQGITDNFYECSLEIFEGLGKMYVEDPRFKKNLDQYGEGFAEYLSKAIAYYVTVC